MEGAAGEVGWRGSADGVDWGGAAGGGWGSCYLRVGDGSKSVITLPLPAWIAAPACFRVTGPTEDSTSMGGLWPWVLGLLSLPGKWLTHPPVLTPACRGAGRGQRVWLEPAGL